ncbi:hypothetical protein ELI_3749 [Eubacterium callanderi]|uniref:Uncharacterized protein n=1 Tax=Eubacterium callanderi TaxID=53442 RepID=E3GGA0_9FIRM|nr:hypothetical protein ELI_3749 [Eubacterium callanderi]
MFLFWRKIIIFPEKMPKNKILSCINAELCYNTIKFRVEY